MEYTRTARINAPLDEVWALTNEVEAVAACIPGLHDLQMQGTHEFDCVVSQRVASVKADFKLHNQITDMQERTSVTVVSDGKDRKLGSTVKATQRFALRDMGDETEVDIVAQIQVTGRIATFGHRIVLAKAEQITVEALENVSALLEKRRTGTTG